ncbi:MAG: YkvA family protein [Fimbriimonas sp.]
MSLANLRQKIDLLKSEVTALYFAARDPETPAIAKWLAAGVAAYALSPIDLIPDFIPVLGYLDDLILVPLGVALVIRLVPEHVMQRSRARAAEQQGKPKSLAGPLFIVTIWLLALAACGMWFFRRFVR